jgi:hypothetical protein
LLRLRSNCGNSWNSFVNRCFNRFAMNSMHGVETIHFLMRRILVLAVRSLSPTVEKPPSDGSDEFLSGAAQKIAEFQRLGREAMESLNYMEARQHLIKARDLATLLFGNESKKAKESNSILAEVNIKYRYRRK